MATSKKRGNNDDEQLRNAADFFTIFLENDNYVLTDEVLKNSVDSRTMKISGWFYPNLKFSSFKDGRLELINSSNKISYKLSILVEKDNLKVACSCAEKIEKLCVHSYRALDKLVFHDQTEYFQNYKPNGLAEIAIANKKHFEFEFDGDGLGIKPKSELGSVYLLKEKAKGIDLGKLMMFPAFEIDKKIKPQNVSTCYVMMVSRRNDFLPFLIPCLGKLNKAGTAIKGFNNFLSGIDKEYEPLLTDEQRTLNHICFDMWKNVEKLRDVSILQDLQNEEMHRFSVLFGLWQNAIPLLQKQYVFKHPFFHTRYLKRKPSKSWIEEIHIHQELAFIQFQLVEKGTFYQLEMEALLNGKALKNYEPITTFFIQHEQKIYMLPSLRDAGISEWMKKLGERVTIFKHYFPQFENNFLKQLRKYYPIKNSAASIKIIK